MRIRGYKLPVEGLIAAMVAIGVAQLAAAQPAPARPAGPVLDKLGGQLRDLATGRQPLRKPAAGGVSPGEAAITRSGKVLVDVYVNGAMSPAADALRDRGMRVMAVSVRSPQRMVEGWLPIDRLDDVAALGRTRAVMPVMGGFLNVGAQTSEGDAAHHGPQARALGPTGAGIVVGVMSDSINQVGGKVAGSQASGDLPADVQVIDELTGGSDEGRAMAEIVYDTAPGIPKIVFARGAGGSIGPAGRAANIDALVANGARVIADDTVFLTEPMFQDGVIAQAADRAKASGAAYFVSAGNRARQSWEGTFTPGSLPSENDFDTGAAEDRRQTLVTIPSGKTIFIALDWDEPVGAVTNDFAIDVYAQPNETTPAFSTTTDNVVTGIPVEATSVVNTAGSPVTVSIGIRRVTGTGSPRLKWITNANFGTFSPLEHNTASQAIDPDAASARGTLAVAAVSQADPGLNDPEGFSSRGPAVTRYFDVAGNRLATPDVRPKPDIAGADNVTTTVPGFAPFFGTSAAAPSAAGVAALLLSARPTMSVDELYAIMRNRAGSVDCTATGFPDADCGFGFVLADEKLRLVDSSPPAITPVTSPAAPNGSNGWFRGDVAVGWNVVDAGSVVVSQTGCGTQPVAGDGVASFTCTATTVGGTASGSVSVKRDSTPPTAPVIAGIAAGRFTAASVPPQSAISCSATDPTSGVASCVVSGYSARPGAHTVTATAVNGAGATSSNTVSYTVVRPAAASRLRAPTRLRFRSLRGAGVLATLDVPLTRTRLVGTLLRGRTAVGTARKTVDAGRASLRVKLNSRGQRLVRAGDRLKIRVRASASDARTVTPARTITIRR